MCLCPVQVITVDQFISMPWFTLITEVNCIILARTLRCLEILNILDFGNFLIFIPHFHHVIRFFITIKLEEILSIILKTRPDWPVGSGTGVWSGPEELENHPNNKTVKNKRTGKNQPG